MSIFIFTIFAVFNIVYAQPGVNPRSENYTFIQSYIHLDVEGTLANAYSGILLFCVSALAFAIIVFSRPQHRFDVTYWVWLVIGALFGVVAYDEYFNPRNLHGQDITLYGYILSGAIAGLCLLYIVWKADKSERWRYLWMIGGLGAIGVSGVLLDNQLLFNISSRDVALLEEILEIIGILTVLVMTLLFASEILPKFAWQVTRPLLFVAIIAVGLLFIFSPRLRNTIEFYLDDVTVDGTIYGDNLIEIVGYSFPEELYQAGDVLIGDIYFRVNRPSSEDYSFSGHLLTIPDAQSIAQQDNENVGNGLTRTWIPQMIVKQAIAIPIPEDAPTPAAYWLSIRLWSSEDGFIESENFEEWQNLTEGFAISSSPNPLLSEDVLLLHDFLMMPDEIPSSLDGEILAFENGIRLVEAVDNVTLAQGDMLDLNFQWSATQAVTRDWRQIVHLQHIETGELFVFDRPPFDGRIPASTWLDGFVANDSLAISVSDNMPSGDYQLLTGLYHPETVERLMIEGYDNGIATIATITIAP